MLKAIVTAIALLASSTLARAEPLAEPVVGPKLICFKYSIFLLGEGEKITDFSGSAEAMAITVEGPSGTFRIGESEIFAPAKGRKRLVVSKGQTSIYRVSSQGGRYAIYGPTGFSNGQDRLIIWLSGDNLRGSSTDRGVLDRFEVRDPASVTCQQTFTYSWDFLIGPAK